MVEADLGETRSQIMVLVAKDMEVRDLEEKDILKICLVDKRLEKLDRALVVKETLVVMATALVNKVSGKHKISTLIKLIFIF